jgi:transcriptional regulator of NAD metabolism
VLIFGKKRGLSKEEAKRLSQLRKDTHKAIIEQKEEEEGIEMEIELENERR